MKLPHISYSLNVILVSVLGVVVFLEKESDSAIIDSSRIGSGESQAHSASLEGVNPGNGNLNTDPGFSLSSADSEIEKIEESIAEARMLYGSHKIKALSAVYGDWVLIDPQAAWDSLEEEGLTIIAERAVRISMSKRLADAGEFEKIFEVWGEERDYFDYFDLFREEPSIFLGQGRDLFLDWIAEDTMDARISSLFASAWAKEDTTAALEWSLGVVDPKKQDFAVGSVVSKVLAYDGLEAALILVSELPDGTQIDAALGKLSRGIRDIETIRTLVESIDDPKTRDNTRRNAVLMKSRRGNVDAVMEFANEIESDETYFDTVKSVYRGLASRSPEEVARRISNDSRLTEDQRNSLAREYAPAE